MMRYKDDPTTLDGMRYILTVKNTENPYLPEGPCTPGTAVVCLRPSYNSHSPCVAHIVRETPTGRITVDLWQDRSERVTVTKKAILWYPEDRTEEE